VYVVSDHPKDVIMQCMYNYYYYLSSPTSKNKSLSYRRGTARRATSVEIFQLRKIAFEKSRKSPSMSITMMQLIITGRIARKANRRYLIYWEVAFRFFALQERHVAPMKMKFGV